MKTAWEYRRISDEDQSNFSLLGQGEYNSKFCGRQQITITKQFEDDGFSAQDFNRPAWRQLEAELKKASRKPDFIVVMKYDRLIRNASEGLAMLKHMEEKLGVYILSAMELFMIDVHSPYFFKIRASMFVDAEFELRQIRDRARFGVWSARSRGRFITVAPFGYTNARDAEDKPIIVVDPTKAPVIQEIFTNFASGMPFQQVWNIAKARGYQRKGHDALKRTLKNPVYAGLIMTPQYKDHEPKLVAGIHESIITEGLYWAVQNRLAQDLAPQPKMIREELPLRGVLQCTCCGGLHTGGRSKGRSAYYWYYLCNTCNGQNYSATKTHDEFKTVLQGLSLSEGSVQYLLEATRREMEVGLQQSTDQLQRVEKQRETLAKKIESLERKYIDDKIAFETYTRYCTEYKAQLHQLNNEIVELTKDTDELWELYRQHLPRLTDLYWIYYNAELTMKQELTRKIFPGGLIKEKVGYRTAFLEPTFHHKRNEINLLHVQRLRKEGTNFEINPLGTRKGIEIEPLAGHGVESLIITISKILAA